MNDQEIDNGPGVLASILRDTERIGFTMCSEPKTGSLLRALAASKPAGRFLELGTGTGVGTAWLLDGMDADSRLDTVDNDARVQDIAKLHLGDDRRVVFHVADGADFLTEAQPSQYDLIFADAWPGKYRALDHVLPLLKLGGFYVVDDLLPQPSWPEDHAPRVASLIPELEGQSGFVSVKLQWASGLMLLVRSDRV